MTMAHLLLCSRSMDLPDIKWVVVTLTYSSNVSGFRTSAIGTANVILAILTDAQCRYTFCTIMSVHSVC